MLSAADLHACLKLRGEVFVVQQQICAVPDVDELDPQCCHAMLRVGSELVATARLLPLEPGAIVKVGRVAVAVDHQRQGQGTALMQAVQQWIGNVHGRSGKMSAQAHLEPWYTRLGWQREGEVYQEAGIAHLQMTYHPG